MSEDRPLELVSCPQCGHVASIEWRRTVHGVHYLKIRCITRHWFLMPAQDITDDASDNQYVAADQITH